MNTRAKDLAIQEIEAELTALEARRVVLCKRLAQIKTVRDFVRQEYRPQPTVFAVGNQVRIKNPGPQQPDTGVITKISESRITVQGDNGVLVIRVAKNLILYRSGDTNTNSDYYSTSPEPSTDNYGRGSELS